MMDVEADTNLSNTGTGMITSNDYAELRNKNRKLEAENEDLKQKLSECIQIIELYRKRLLEFSEVEEDHELIKRLSELNLNTTPQQKITEEKCKASGLVTQASVDGHNSATFNPEHTQPHPSKNQPVDRFSLPWSPEYRHPDSALVHASPDAAPVDDASIIPINWQPVASEAKGEMAFAGDMPEKPGCLISLNSAATTIPVVQPDPIQASKKKDYRVNDEMCNFIKKNVVKKRRELGRELGLSDVDLDEIEVNVGTGNVKEVTYQIMRTWIQKKGKDATTLKLIKALQEIDRNDLVAEFRDKFSESISESDQSSSKPTKDVNQIGKVQQNWQQDQVKMPHAHQNPNEAARRLQSYKHQPSAAFHPGKPVQQQTPSLPGARQPANRQHITHSGPTNQYQPPVHQPQGAFNHRPPVQQEPNQHGGMVLPLVQKTAWSESSMDSQIAEDKFQNHPCQSETPHDPNPIVTDSRGNSRKPSEFDLETFFTKLLRNPTSKGVKEFKKGLDKVKNLKRDEIKRISNEMDWTEELKDKFDSDIKSNFKVSNVLAKWVGVVYTENPQILDNDPDNHRKKDKFQDFIRSLRKEKDGWDGREDVVKEICKHVKPGTVGTQAPPTTCYTDLPYGVRFTVSRELNMLNDNTGRGCSAIAEALGIENNLIRYLASRPEPGHQVLRSWETQSDATVQKLYEVLIKCEVSQALEALEKP